MGQSSSIFSFLTSKSISSSSSSSSLDKKGNKKRKKKQRRRKGKKRVSASSPARPGSPPRGLKNILHSAALTDEYRAFLAGLDTELETNTRVKWLDFWLACRALDDLNESKDGDGVKAQLGRMAKDFFGSSGSGSGVSLSNDSVRKECGQICSKQKGNDLRPLWLAQNDVAKKLDGLHQDFLATRAAKNGSVVDRLQQCLL